MFDERIRRGLGPVLARLADGVARVGVRPNQLTALGLVLALAAAVAAGLGAWLVALALWLLSRLVDGLDGALARRTGAATDLGGLLDVLADFLAYGAFVLGVAVALPDARVASAALLLAYYLNGSAFLALSALAERRSRTLAAGDRSLQFVGGLTEGFETILAHSLFAVAGLVAPDLVVVLVWAFTAMVAVTVAQRVVVAVRVLGDG